MRSIKKILASHPVKTTSLLYIGEALRQERFEQCPEMIQIAREFGASEKEIESLVGSYVRHDRSDFSLGPQWLFSLLNV
ncbi:MAG: hypothetical protein HYZ83_04920 [Candidatus Omnitrophica bacterium]|nr:hypothetical protein [Candidatus Omnitrophota bacterium]